MIQFVYLIHGIGTRKIQYGFVHRILQIPQFAHSFKTGQILNTSLLSVLQLLGVLQLFCALQLLSVAQLLLCSNDKKVKLFAERIF